jgi:hypothetical protein
MHRAPLELKKLTTHLFFKKRSTPSSQWKRRRQGDTKIIKSEPDVDPGEQCPNL